MERVTRPLLADPLAPRGNAPPLPTVNASLSRRAGGPLPTAATALGSAAAREQEQSVRPSSIELKAVYASDASVEAAQLAIGHANREFEARTVDHLKTAIAVLFEQRDEALSRLASLLHGAEEDRAHLLAEHDRFVAYLMEEQQRKLQDLQAQLQTTNEALERQRALHGAAPSSQLPSSQGPVPQLLDPQTQRSQVQDLRRLLEMAYAELDEVKAVVPALEDERDAALRVADDVRVELYGEVERARDEAIALQTQLDDAQRQFDDVLGQARVEAHAQNERLNETERELDERRAEVERLRHRLDSLAHEVKFSHPPPPALSDELLKARAEVQQLRHELIEAKRELSRVTRDHAALRTLRSTAMRQVSGVAAPQLPAAAGQQAPIEPVLTSPAGEAPPNES